MMIIVAELVNLEIAPANQRIYSQESFIQKFGPEYCAVT